jgi:hypothetical protein
MKPLPSLAFFHDSLCPICFMQLMSSLGPKLGIWILIWVGAFSSLLFFGVILVLDIGPLFAFLPFPFNSMFLKY